MLTSSFALYSSIEALSKEAASYQRMLTITGTPPPATQKWSKYAATARLILALVFFLIELWLLYFMLKYVFATTTTGPGRNLRVIMLIFFTVPVTLLSSSLDPNFANTINSTTGTSSRRRSSSR